MPYTWRPKPDVAFPMPEWFELGVQVIYNDQHQMVIRRIDEAKATFHCERQGVDRWWHFSFREINSFQPVLSLWQRIGS